MCQEQAKHPQATKVYMHTHVHSIGQGLGANTTITELRGGKDCTSASYE